MNSGNIVICIAVTDFSAFADIFTNLKTRSDRILYFMPIITIYMQSSLCPIQLIYSPKVLFT